MKQMSRPKSKKNRTEFVRLGEYKAELLSDKKNIFFRYDTASGKVFARKNTHAIKTNK
ncbi:hypothetical protein KCTCHS21_50710 [Cohnella abietis]|uniref:Uncharacterized protein n=1 Tax=Cohnella abietis TaxID=2507935 RepID=A0A3T1DC45_9BACL|nr:hypothetical protein KCTCHS21_50710 [Cohnella abietis]